MDTPVPFFDRLGTLPPSHPSVTHATTQRVAVGSVRLHEGETACQYEVFASSPLLVLFGLPTWPGQKLS